MTNNVMIVSGRQQSDLVIHTSIHSTQTPLPSRLPHDFEHSPLCNTVDPCWLSILNITVCTLDSTAFYSRGKGTLLMSIMLDSGLWPVLI